MTRSPTLDAIYDAFADTYHENRALFDVGPVLEEFHTRLPDGPGRLLDLGCGAGEPVARWFLARQWSVTGVDFSPRMLELARRYAPEMTRVHGDMRELEQPPESFDAITAFYSLFHLPSADHPALFQRIHRWLRPGGRALFTYASEDYTGAPAFDGYKEFMGQALYYGHLDSEGLDRALNDSGLAVEDVRPRLIGGETFLWVTARRD